MINLQGSLDDLEMLTVYIDGNYTLEMHEMKLKRVRLRISPINRQIFKANLLKHEDSSEKISFPFISSYNRKNLLPIFHPYT